MYGAIRIFIRLVLPQPPSRRQRNIDGTPDDVQDAGTASCVALPNVYCHLSRRWQQYRTAQGKIVRSCMEYGCLRKRLSKRLLCCVILGAVLILIGFGAVARSGKPQEDVHPPAPEVLDYDLAWVKERESMSVKLGRPVADILSMEWDARPVSLLFSGRREVAAFVDSIGVEGKELLTDRQLRRLRWAVTEFLFCNGTNDRKSYYRRLLQSREGLDEMRLKGIWNLALQRDQPDVLNREPLEQLVWYCQEAGLQTHWRGLVAQGTRMKVLSTHIPDLPCAGAALEKLLGRGLSGVKKTAPPVTLEGAVRSKGSILVADLEVLVADDQRATEPYFCRYWYDADSSVWRLASVTGYPMCAGPPRDIIY
jgi:hypothetical protein